MRQLTPDLDVDITVKLYPLNGDDKRTILLNNSKGNYEFYESNNY